MSRRVSSASWPSKANRSTRGCKDAALDRRTSALGYRPARPSRFAATAPSGGAMRFSRPAPSVSMRSTTRPFAFSMRRSLSRSPNGRPMSSATLPNRPTSKRAPLASMAHAAWSQRTAVSALRKLFTVRLAKLIEDENVLTRLTTDTFETRIPRCPRPTGPPTNIPRFLVGHQWRNRSSRSWKPEPSKACS